MYLFLSVCLEAYSSWETSVLLDRDRELRSIRSECYLNYSSFRFFLAGDFYQRNPEDFTLAVSTHGLYLGPLQQQGTYRIIRASKGIPWTAFNEKCSIELNRESKNIRNQGVAWQNRYAGLFYSFREDEKSWGLHFTPGAFQSVFVMTENLVQPQYERDPWFSPAESIAREMMHVSFSYSFLQLGFRLNSTISLSPYATAGMLGTLYGKWKIAKLRLELLTVFYHPAYRSSSGELAELYWQSKVKSALPLGHHWIIKGKGEWENYRSSDYWEATLASSIHWLSSHSVEINLSGEMDGNYLEGWQEPATTLKMKWDRFYWGGELALLSENLLELQKIRGEIHCHPFALEATLVKDQPWTVEKFGCSWSPASLVFSCNFSEDFSVLECKCRWKF